MCHEPPCSSGYNLPSMAITLSDLPELLRLLEQHPEWRQALRLVLLGEELLQMPHLLQQLIAAQQEVVEVLHRHEQQIAELIQVQRQILETQQRHEQTLQRHEQQILETQQRHEQTLQRQQEMLQRQQETLQRHEETLQRHEDTLTQVLEVQRQHSEILAQVLQVQLQHTQAIQELRSYVGNLTQSLGLTIEENAEDMLLYVMEKKGWRLVQGPHSLSTEGELDLIAVFEDELGQTHTVLMEVKMRLSRSTVEQWADRMRSEGFQSRLRAQGFEPPFYPYLFGFRVDMTAEEAARVRQVGLITSRGEIVEPVVLL